MNSSLLVAVTNISATHTWNSTVGIIISGCSFLALLLSCTISKPMVGTKIPLFPISIPTFIGAMCFGHILGVGVILGLYNIGKM
ncbi:photosystem I reaction center subunit PsaK [Brunnivagina elsteri]|uniref:Photosystem I reaction center subunit PsaK n=1 Tax=Brunnivagina elsteri CCALA 953 TaxID=987040 RepID=A0A2A2TF86_9CYAN|nr:photosystem I reaction center subunit PsaK [Calothrix elsteri]PAX52420.1 photosystem I reaction center subunit PsaK [Calothrix elsteri CCALA 953]